MNSSGAVKFFFGSFKKKDEGKPGLDLLPGHNGGKIKTMTSAGMREGYNNADQIRIKI